MADEDMDSNIDPALTAISATTTRKSSVLSDLTPLATPALSPVPRVEIATPDIPSHVQETNTSISTTSNGAVDNDHAATTTTGSSNLAFSSYSRTDIPIFQSQATPQSPAPTLLLPPAQISSQAALKPQSQQQQPPSSTNTQAIPYYSQSNYQSQGPPLQPRPPNSAQNKALTPTQPTPQPRASSHAPTQAQSQPGSPAVPPPPVAGIKRKQDGSSHSRDLPIMKCPYQDSRKCKKEYKHKNAMRYHLEQAHAQEPDFQQRLADYPAQPASKKAKIAASKSGGGASSSSVPPSTASTSTAAINGRFSTTATTTMTAPPTAAASAPPTTRPIVPPPPPVTTSAPNPFFGLFTHGYVFSSAGLPFRPHNRPIDALYYLNILSTAGIKSQQQRASERLMINALLNADFIKHLQDNVNTGINESTSSEIAHTNPQYHHRLDLLDDKNMLKYPTMPIQPSAQPSLNPYSKRDADSAILKLAKTLQDVGLGDGIDNAQYF